MGSNTVIWKIRVTYFDEQSIMIDNGQDFVYYIPEENTTFRKSSWYEKDKKTFNSTFTELDDDIYLVKKQVVQFDIINNISLTEVTDDEDNDYDSFNLHLIWKDIEPNISKFGKDGKYESTFLIVVLEHWWQCWEGDWDCNYEYIGIVNNNIDPKLLITDNSRENKIKRDLKFNKQFE